MTVPYRELQVVPAATTRRSRRGVFEQLERWWFEELCKVSLPSSTEGGLYIRWDVRTPRGECATGIPLDRLDQFNEWLQQQSEDEDLLLQEPGGSLLTMPWIFVRECKRAVAECTRQYHARFRSD